MKFISTILYWLLLTSTCLAQNCGLKLSGHIADGDTKEKLETATVIIQETGMQVVTNSKGDFIFTNLCYGEYTLLISHVGCDSVMRKIRLTKDQHFDLFLPHTRNELGPVFIDAHKPIANTGFKKELSGRALEQTLGLSLGEALSKINGVNLLQTGSTISKPVIHGLHGNRILTINNGVRQEGQQWGNEHAPEIDPFIADKLVVIKGVDELRYGSDAIGGVILVEPKPFGNNAGSAAEINMAYFTNNRLAVVSGVFEQPLNKQPALRYRVQGTFKKGANATTPHYRLNNTGSEEKNFSLTVGWKKKTFNTEVFYSYFDTKLGIFTGSHIGNLTDLENAIAATKPNEVFLGQNSYKIQRPRQAVRHQLVKSKTNFYKNDLKFTLLIAGQFNNRKEFDIVRSSTNTSPQLNLSIATFSQDLSFEHPRKDNFSGIGGLSMMQQNNSYTGRYFIPNYFAYTMGGYYIEKWSKHQWELQAGVRYDHKIINTTRLKFNGDTLNYGFNFSTWALSLNAIYKPNEHWRLNTNFSLANRAPYVNELLSEGIHHGTATYEKGDIALKPERSLNISVGINYQHPSKMVMVDVLLYSNSIRHFIYQQPMPNKPVLTIAGAFPLVQYLQTNAVLSGLDITAHIKPYHALEWISKFSYLHARNATLNDWLILMPANRINNEFSYQLTDNKTFNNSYASVEIMHVMQQKNVPNGAIVKQDYKAPPAAYTLLNLNASTSFLVGKTPLTLSMGVRNLLNTVYRDYLNSMRYFADEMGRNISVRLKIKIP